MKPAEFIKRNELAMKYFNDFSKVLEDRGIDNDAFSVELSQLCNEYSKYHEAALDTEIKGLYQEAKTGWQQISPWVQIQDKCLANISKLSPKFGFTPADLEKLGESVRKKTEEPKTSLELLMERD